MPVMETIAIGSILGNLFGNIFGAKTQANAATNSTNAQIAANNRAAELEKQSFDEALAYQKELDARDYADWLRLDDREYGRSVELDLRNRRDFEASEQRRAPYRALGDSAIRTLADYIAVPGMRPAQEVPVPIWTPSASTATSGSAASARASASGGRVPTSNTMPVDGGTRITPAGNPRELTNTYLSQNPGSNPGSLRDFMPGYQQYMQDQGYQVELIDHPTRLDKITITDPDGRSQVVDMVVGAGGDSPTWGWMEEGAAGGGGAGAAAASSASASRGGWRNTSPQSTLLAKYSQRRPATLAGFMTA